jgi:toxin ParE1/3/4
MAEIIWTPQSLDDLQRLLEYIAFDSPVTACRFAERIVGRVEQLSDHPLSGSVIPEDDDGVYRQLVQGNYRLIYRVAGDRVFIIAVQHAARLLQVDELE